MVFLFAVISFKFSNKKTIILSVFLWFLRRVKRVFPYLDTIGNYFDLGR